MKKQLNNNEIAKESRSNPQAVGKWMRKESFPSFKNLTKLAKATNMTVNEVVKMLTK